MSILSREEFIELAKSGKHDAESHVRKEFAFDAPVVNEAERTVKFTITTGDVDRDNDVINPKGWDLSDYLKSPVVLWAHDHQCPPIARAVTVQSTKNGLVSVAKFPDAGVFPFADMIFNLIKGGFIRAASVGFKPVEYALDEKRQGVNFSKQSMLEWSVVPVPANANALVSASAAGINLAPMKKWLSGVLAEWPGELDLPEAVRAKVAGTAKPKTRKADDACPTCNGSGKSEDDTCGTCDGTGKFNKSAKKSDEKTNDMSAQMAAFESRLDKLFALVESKLSAPAKEVSEEDDGIVFVTEDEDDPDVYDVDPVAVRGLLTDAIGQAVRAMAEDATRQAIRQARGRLD